VAHNFVDMEKVLDRISHAQPQLFISELSDEAKLNDVVRTLVAEQAAVHQRLSSIGEVAAAGEEALTTAQENLFPTETDRPQTFDAAKLEADLKDRLREYSKLAIDVPWINADTTT